MLQQLVFLLQQLRWFADHRSSADLRELPVDARRQLDEDDVTFYHHTTARRAHGQIMRGGAHQEEVVLRPQRFHVTEELGRQLELAHAGPYNLEQMLVPLFSDLGRLTRTLDLVRILASSGPPDNVIHALRTLLHDVDPKSC